MIIESLKWRWIIVITATLAAIIWNVPNFAGTNTDNWLTDRKIVYGLDIQGGLHLVMGVDVDAVITEKVARESRNIRKELKDEAIPYKAVVIPPEDQREFHIQLASPDQAAAVRAYLEKYWGTTLQIVDENPQRTVVRYYDAKVLEYRKQVVEQAIEVIRNRIDEFGVSEPHIAAQGDNRILVQLPGIEDSARAKELINRTAQLTFQGLSKDKNEAEILAMIKEVEEAGKYAIDQEGLSYQDYIKRLNKDLASKLPPATKVVFEKLPNAVAMSDGARPLLISTDSELTGGELEDASVRPDEYGSPEVNFRFSVEGRRKFAALTEKYAGGSIAIVLDDVVKSAPTVREKIDSAQARITLDASRGYQETNDEARFIATSLRAGALPAALQQLEERTVGPTLGADSIRKGKMAGMVGGALVLLFMFLYYRGSLGAVADTALVLNILFLLAILTNLGATLTLPGVAGIVLTVGMAVDANIIIFERIKEELAKGASVRAAVKDGYGHAFSAIFDANITTAVVCIVLMYFGTGPVRGFAVTLICGIVTSMFTAIFVSRTIMDTFGQKMGLQRFAQQRG